MKHNLCPKSRIFQGFIFAFKCISNLQNIEMVQIKHFSNFRTLQEHQPTYCMLKFPSQSRGEKRLREGLSLNAAFYIGSKRELVGRGDSLVLHPRVVDCRSRVSDATSDLWKCLSSPETPSEGGGRFMGMSQMAKRCETKQCYSLYTHKYKLSPENGSLWDRNTPKAIREKVS